MNEANLDDQKLKVPELPPGKLFHIFFSYAENDREFTCRLIDKLENELKLKCCEHTRDFTPGWPITDNIKHCVMTSLKTVVIVSPEFVKSQWCSYESEMTLHLSMDMRRKILIPMIIDDCTIPDHLKPLTYIDARGDTAQWWSKLLLAIESPTEIPIFESGLPVLSSEPFSFNPHYSNLDSLVNLTSKSRSCINEEIRSQTVPCSLCRKGIQVPHVVFEEQMAILNRSTLFKNHNCWYPSRKNSIVLTILLMVVCSYGISLTTKLANECPIRVSCNFYILTLGMVLAPFVFFVVSIFLLFKRDMNEYTLIKIISAINKSFVPYQVMLTYKRRRSSKQGFKAHTQSRLQKNMKKSSANSRLHFTSETISNRQGILQDDTSGPTQLVNSQSENAFTSSIQKNENSKNGIEQLSKDILLRHSAKYLQLFLDEKLTRPDSPRHTMQVMCLCQYVEIIKPLTSRADPSSNIIEV